MASNQSPPARPWFRMASQVRLEQPQAPGRLQPAAPPPRPIFGRLPSLIPFNQPAVQESPSPPPAPELPPATRPLSSAGALTQEGPRAPTPPQRSSPLPVSAEPPAAAAVVELPKVIRPTAPTPPHSPRTQVLPSPSPPPARLVDRIPPSIPKANDEVESTLSATTKKIDAPSPYNTPTPPRSPSFLERRNPPLQDTHATRSPSPAIEERSIKNPTPGATPPLSPTPPKRLGQPYFRRVEEDKTTVSESGGIKPAGSSKKKKPAASEAPIGAFGMLTLSGDNVGAHMELLGGQRRRNASQAGPFPGHPYRLKNEAESNHDTVLHDGVKPNKGASSAVPMAALVNSNVQGANNSILFGSTCVHGSPGVHITLSSSTKPRRRLEPPLKATSPRTNHAPK